MVGIIRAKTVGFCFGVKKAVDKAFEMADPGRKVYTYGPVIHNAEVIKSLSEKGVKLIESEEELRVLTEGTVILRSHGVPKAIIDLLKEKGIDYLERARNEFGLENSVLLQEIYNNYRNYEFNRL